jgi:Kef-type K+ transport system membrane component KefB
MGIKFKFISVLGVLFLLTASTVLAAGSYHFDGATLGQVALWLFTVLLAAKGAKLFERIGQSSVLGELLIGAVIGNLFLLGINVFEPIKGNEIIIFLAELGVLILLFQIGLESNIKQMSKVGANALMVAFFGAFIPLVLGFLASSYFLFPDGEITTHLFLGAALSATSVGITARIFKDSGRLSSKEAQVVLGAAVIDDVLGILMLALISKMAEEGSVDITEGLMIVGVSVAFLAGAIVAGHVAAPLLSSLFGSISKRPSMEVLFPLGFLFLFGYFAEISGLVPIIGAFAAGLVLDPVQFKNYESPQLCSQIREEIKNEPYRVRKKIEPHLQHEESAQVEHLIEPIGYFLTPIFFIHTGMLIELQTILDPGVILIALLITVLAFLSKFFAGYLGGKGVDKNIIGLGMVPRGEVGLIFASAGNAFGVLPDSAFSIIVIVVILTTFIAPIFLSGALKKQSQLTEQKKLRHAGG